jgi:Tol biopolymer transport system component
VDDKAEEARLLAIAAAVSEGADVDWDRAARASDSAHGQLVLRGLRLIDSVARVHRSERPDDKGSRAGGLETLDGALPPAGPADWAHLHILKELGQGAFGTVYRAWDPRLEREVALKLLSAPSLARGALLLREARLLARVRHANVVTVYGAEDIDDRIGIWMESVRGQTLDQLMRLAGRLGPQEAALVGLALCRALAAVHAAGLVHRDVKARNVMREEGGRIVLMDFGAGSDLATTSTESIGPAGTPLYMAPEILDGARPTPAADIYSLGVLLYHLVTQTYPVNGATKGEIHDAHRRGERRRLRDARPDLPEAFVQTVERALADEPSKRHESAGAFEEALASAVGGGQDSGAAAQEPASWWRRWALPAGVGVAAMAASLLGASVWMAGRPASVPEAPRARFDIFGPHQSAIDAVSISPDGTHIAFVAEGQLWVRALEALEPRALAGTSGANNPFWSPDGHDIGFFSGTKLKRVAISGEEPRTICEARRPRGGSWSSRGVILFASALGAVLQQAPAEGGEPVTVRQPDAAHGDQEIDWPAFLPDGVHYLYVLRSRDPDRAGLFVASLPGAGLPGAATSGSGAPGAGSGAAAAASAGKSESDDAKRLLDISSNVAYAGGSIVYVRRGTMLARPFDTRTLQFTGQPTSLVERVDSYAFDSGGYAEFAASGGGEIVYRGGIHPDRELRWFDRQGLQISTVPTGRLGEGNLGEYRDFALSPDAARLAYDQLDPHSGRRDVWVLDLASGGTIRLTFDPDDDGTPVWSPDGRSLIFASNRGGQFALYRKAADGSGDEERLFDAQAVPLDWSSDGKLLVYEVFDQKTGTDLFMLPLQGAPGAAPGAPGTASGGGAVGTPQVFLQTEFMEREPQFSPDTRWMAYSSSESSQRQVYLQPIVNAGNPAASAFVRRWQVSPGYGREPRWRADGRELFYIGPDEMLTAVSISLGSGTVTIGPPRPLFRLRITGSDVRQHYAVSPDGQRFLVNTLIEGVQPSPMTLVLNAMPRAR